MAQDRYLEVVYFHLFLLQLLSAEITYGVVPDAEIPTTKSLELTLKLSKSFQPWFLSSSAFSILFRIALSPPAITPIT